MKKYEEMKLFVAQSIGLIELEISILLNRFEKKKILILSLPIFKKKKQENYPRVKNFLLLERNASRKSKVGQKNIRHQDKISNIIIEVGEEQLLRSSLSLLAQSDFRSPD